MHLYVRKFVAGALAVAISLGAATGAEAAENGVINYALGGPSPFIGVWPPVPGLFAFSQTNYTYADGLYDSSGKKTATPFKMSAYSELIRVLASYDFTLFGARVYSQFAIPIVGLETTIFASKNSDWGVANIVVSPIIINWTWDVHSVTMGLDVATPISSYYDTDPVIGNNYASISPTLAYRYNDPEGLEWGVLGRLIFNAENTETSYQSGTDAVVDFMLNWHFGKWSVGVVGGYAVQLEGDKLFGRDIGNKLMEFKAGPSISYDAGAVLFNLNWQPCWYVENGANTSTVWLNIAFPIYAAGAPPAGGARH